MLTLNSPTAGPPHSSSRQGGKESEQMGEEENNKEGNLEDEDLI